jgi:phospholipase C
MLDSEEPWVSPNAENSESDHPGRRGFVAGIAAATAAAQLPIPADAMPAGGTVPDDFSDIQHVVVVTMENRSFDHMLGWVPNAEAKQSGRIFTNSSGMSFPSYRLPRTWNWFAGDPDHSYQAGRVCYANGAMNGFLLTETIVVGNLAAAFQDDPFPLGYFTRDRLPFYAGAAD